MQADAREDLNALLITTLNTYEMHVERELAKGKLGQFLTATFGSVGEGRVQLGDLPQIKKAFRQMQERLYSN